MAVDLFQASVSTVWRQSKSVTGFSDATQAYNFRAVVEPTVSGAALNRIYPVQATLAFGASVTIDLRSLTEPYFGEALTPARAYTLQLEFSGATARYQPGVLFPLLWFFGLATDTLNFNAGDIFLYGSETPATVDATNRNVKITNTHGSLTLTYRFAVSLGV